MAQHTIIANSGRQFAVFPVGLIALIIDQHERFLMLKHPQHGTYEPVNGGYDGGETLLEGFLREIREEAGEQIQIRPMSAVHTYNFRYDDSVPYMISIIFLFEYLGGEVIPGDDMVGAEIKWMTVAEINSGQYRIPVPSQVTWVYERAAKLYRLLKDDVLVELQPPLEGMSRKYDKP
jgi:ADP-ribose pyrophosphatase YjhB (NUDIX family)